MCDEVEGVMMDNMYMDIKNVDSRQLAQQLTCMDAVSANRYPHCDRTIRRDMADFVKIIFCNEEFPIDNETWIPPGS